MLSYPIAEAETLLESRLAVAQESLANCEEDLDFLREQITVTTTLKGTSGFPDFSLIWIQTLEVATARVYNWDVTQKRKEKAEQGVSEDDEKRILPNG